MNSKAQASIELVTALVIMILILVLMVVYSIDRTQESADIKTFIDAKRISGSVGDNLDSIQQQGRGYYKYFSIPERLQGNYEYNLTISQNVVELAWNDKAWAVTTIASNVVVYCLDYGLNSTNRVRNEGNNLSITCYKPNLRPLDESFRYWNDGGNVTVSVHFENDAQVGSADFNISLDGAGKGLSGLNPYEEVEINHTIIGFPSGGYPVVIVADVTNRVEESIESDNMVNRTITI
ncbi:MAG: hypothetical protein PHG85_00510 [Candidatus Altiarchaeota archaeon]|nr:hypothetical protein [Candidatus Altiarchaeota archaeon]